MSPFLSEQFPSGLVLPSVQVGKPRAEHDLQAENYGAPSCCQPWDRFVGSGR